MLTLEPKLINFRISTTYLQLNYLEPGTVKITLDCIESNKNDNNSYFKVEMNFYTVAEVKCITMNFYESNHNEFHIIPNKNIMESGFYEVINSDSLKEKKHTYDPINRLGLKHYIITGNDSYIELLASNYTIDRV
ncbi:MULTISPECIES: hypothetical protein [Citrobacter]|uniref:hypothetical protein n=1 Tax=Citrobacter TaxID=544 RepID=UPI000501826C|nr:MULTISPECIES: hypothetical protein [Citrobacter]RNL75574.1 hypothetical protein D7I40_00020 [Citrobacter sp. MH181794]TKU75087.1 hypothetical protein FDW92_10655 [Citrobacter sp. wls706]UCA23262.1 hypothetical protein LA356_12960 [Citrobacter werkmanii]GAL44621.1 hypothetical protein CIWKM_07_04670 [Citrobacter werkmanii NBRC 105721]